jgi:hypothetical protein
LWTLYSKNFANINVDHDEAALQTCFKTLVFVHRTIKLQAGWTRVAAEVKKGVFMFRVACFSASSRSCSGLRCESNGLSAACKYGGRKNVSPSAEQSANVYKVLIKVDEPPTHRYYLSPGSTGRIVVLTEDFLNRE